MLEKEIVSKRILDCLNMCKVEKIDKYFEIELPVILYFNQQLISLRLYPCDDWYYVSTTDTVFDEYAEYALADCEKYYNLFVKNDSSYHYDIKQDGAYLYKKYEANYSARHAVNEFVRFLVDLDRFILDYWNKEE